jgi:kynurenine formamidase
VGNPGCGFYNGLPAPEDRGTPEDRLGIHAWARRGIAGRGVLLDVAEHFARAGKPLAGNETYRITVADLEEVRRAEGVEIGTGDVLIVRTGWMAWYLQTPERERRFLTRPERIVVPGIENSEAMAEYLWDLHISAITSDNPSVEAAPPLPGDFGLLHRILLPLFGMALGELWYLEGLANDCAEDGRYSFFFTSAPLNKQGGIGSPPNAIAIK